MTGGFHVDTAQLKSHSSTVDKVAETVEEAYTAAASETIGGLVYGVLFDPLVLVGLGIWGLHIQEVIQQNVDLGHAIAEGLAANAETYEGIEQTTSTTLLKSGE